MTTIKENFQNRDEEHKIIFCCSECAYYFYSFKHNKVIQDYIIKRMEEHCKIIAKSFEIKNKGAETKWRPKTC